MSKVAVAERGVREADGVRTPLTIANRVEVVKEKPEAVR